MSEGRHGFAEVVDHTDLNRAAYDRLASRYQANRDMGGEQSWFAELEAGLLARVGPGAPLADLACGPGSDGVRFARLGRRVIAADLSMGMATLARDRLGSRVVQADLRELPLAAGAVEGIWCAAALLHVPEAHTVQALGEMRRILRTSGTLALVTALGEGTQLEQVPYAPEEKRWFVYRDAAQVRLQLAAARFSVLEAGELSRGRHWSWVLAAAA